MYKNLLFILIPLIIGYLFTNISNYWLRIIEYVLNIIVYIILFLMGISLASLPNLANNLLCIMSYTSVSAICILSMNALALFLLEKFFPWKITITQLQPNSTFHVVLSSLKLCIGIIIGFIIGLTNCSWLSQAAKISELLLFILLWLVGIQLRNSGITLKQIILNRRGLLITVVVAISALIGGIIAAILLDLPLHAGLALASAYGWYSLSGILMTDAYGAIIGSIAFLNDLLRELLSMILIPLLIKRWKNVALGLCGSTSMDFTLPILKRSGGIEIIPAAIIQGFLLSLLAPILIAIFSMHN